MRIYTAYLNLHNCWISDACNGLNIRIGGRLHAASIRNASAARINRPTTGSERLPTTLPSDVGSGGGRLRQNGPEDNVQRGCVQGNQSAPPRAGRERKEGKDAVIAADRPFCGHLTAEYPGMFPASRRDLP